jgi:hypothetical protein
MVSCKCPFFFHLLYIICTYTLYIGSRERERETNRSIIIE